MFPYFLNTMYIKPGRRQQLKRWRDTSEFLLLILLDSSTITLIVFNNTILGLQRCVKSIVENRRDATC